VLWELAVGEAPFSPKICSHRESNSRPRGVHHTPLTTGAEEAWLHIVLSPTSFLNSSTRGVHLEYFGIFIVPLIIVCTNIDFLILSKIIFAFAGYVDHFVKGVF
jgi:hypothetical protein